MSFTWIRPDGSSIALDLTRSETWTPSVTVTDHPVEDGTTVSDHAQVRPLSGSVEGDFTESPFVGREGNLPVGPDRLQTAIEFLEAALGEILTVVSTRRGTIQNILITSFRHRFDSSKRMRVTVQMRQVRLAEVGFVQIPPGAPADAQKAGFPDGQDAGNQTTQETEGAQEVEDKSIAFGLLQVVGIF